MTNRLPALAAAPRRIVVLRGRTPGRLQLGHPWVFRNEIARVDGVERPTNLDPGAAAGRPQPAVAEVRDAAGRFVGRGVWSPVSAIAVRLFTRRPGEALDDALVAARTRAALALRQPLLAGADPAASSCRLIFAEGDGLPGLIVDKFGRALVFQSLALAAETCRDTVLKVLSDNLAPQYVVERNDVSVRTLEGLPEHKGMWPEGTSPPPSGHVTIVEGGARMTVDVLEGQKTGYYLDQRDNRAAVRRLAAALVAAQPAGAAATATGGRLGIDVLDCFAYSGGFAVAAAMGANGHLGRLVCVDASGEALALAAENLELNGYGGRAEMIAGNAFDELRRMDRERSAGQFDLIILDPPPFARERRMVESALRGYKEINLRAMKLLRPNGYLVTCTCSHHLDRESFLATLTEAAADADARMQVVEVRGQPPDHPVLLGYPEGDYLKCYVLRKAPRG
ncbi:MAG: class I SAM-dependent rRNA methyltransferase [Bacillota bacterium]|nr:class I SAM-dependent rRNA methyltransferase [Bacillota bacterium]